MLKNTRYIRLKFLTSNKINNNHGAKLCPGCLSNKRKSCPVPLLLAHRAAYQEGEFPGTAFVIGLFIIGKN